MAYESRTHGSGLRLVGACYGLTIFAMVLGIVVVAGLSFFVLAPLGIQPTGINSLVVSLVAIQGIAFPGAAILYFRYTGRSLRAFVPVSIPSLKEVGLIIGAWIGAQILVPVLALVIISLFETQPAQNGAGQTARENPEFIPFLIPLVFLLNAPGEELLFRGVVQGLLRERFSAAGAILLATGAFAPIHITALIGSPRAALVTITILSVPSIIFGAVYEVTDNIVAPTLVHALYNATLFGGLYLVSTG